ncbi:hypothetical protein [Phreatobacter stygius]|uniref:Uncharacterized protein n=1 Tax=Phreatobacter stygius TaxID=1940610 RepID=A0A4D7BAQ5_9HYPH|nr:hypothetical protein [Phreatobacter stygius]QCI67763.1 hypothetical protein E8M01_28195 [Phreatobacter stygius]
MTRDEPWMRPYVLSITGLFLEEGFGRLAEALGRLDPAAAEATLARFEEMIGAEIANIGAQEDIPPAVLVGLRRNVQNRMATVVAKARQRLAAAGEAASNSMTPAGGQGNGPGSSQASARDRLFVHTVSMP